MPVDLFNVVFDISFFRIAVLMFLIKRTCESMCLMLFRVYVNFSYYIFHFWTFYWFFSKYI